MENAHPERPVIMAQIERADGFDAQVEVYVELADGSQWEMHPTGMGDVERYELPVFMLGIPCGAQPMWVHAESGLEERVQSVQIHLPCPEPLGGP